jgi:hypothetical protein
LLLQLSQRSIWHRVTHGFVHTLPAEPSWTTPNCVFR